MLDATSRRSNGPKWQPIFAEVRLKLWNLPASRLVLVIFIHQWLSFTSVPSWKSILLLIAVTYFKNTVQVTFFRWRSILKVFLPGNFFAVGMVVWQSFCHFWERSSSLFSKWPFPITHGFIKKRCGAKSVKSIDSARSWLWPSQVSFICQIYPSNNPNKTVQKHWYNMQHLSA